MQNQNETIKNKFKDIPLSPNYPELEKSLLSEWESKSLMNKAYEKTKKSGKPAKIYYDGPITANALPHYGHGITWALKDIIPRYWTMNGHFVSRNIGWDCQGIPVEYEIEKALNFKEKSDIEKLGVAKFNQLCRESVLKYRDAMRVYEKRLGRWIDDNDSYETMDSKYIESVWWSLKSFYDQGLLYEGHKVVAYSTRAGTTLSNAEVALGGYKEIIDPAVTVKFKSKKFDAYYLAWTTTPWTLPGNLMLAVGEKIRYVLVESNGEKFILAKDTVDKVFAEKSYVIQKELDASELEGDTYTPLFDYFLAKVDEGCFKVIFGDHVTTDEGTGIVHLAPYGEDDFDIFTKKGIKGFDYLDDLAHFDSTISEFSGLFYKQANPKIIEHLQNKSLLFELKDYAHQMPMCWRTNTPLIYKPVKSWYLAVTKFKDQLVSENKKINWVPEHARDGRFGSWLENARDWALSRKRYWGTPLPVWVNDKTGDVVVVGSFKELEEYSGKVLGENFDPHKPFVDEITWEDKTNGGIFKRVEDVIDVWYDSGAMPFARHHYPFENKEKFEANYPAEYISESVDQTRGWFYSLIVINTPIFGKAPYQNVVMSGMLGDEQGKKLSKSKKNYQPMEEVLNKQGGDALRYFLLSSPIVNGSTARFSEEFLEESRKSLFTTLWNSYRYFVTYANLYEIDFKTKNESKNLLDKWIIFELNKLVRDVRSHLDKFHIMEAAVSIKPFVDDLSTWYIRRSRDRLSNGDVEALKTLYKVLLDLSKVIAPFVPFLSDEIYKNLISIYGQEQLESVHLADFPIVDASVDLSDVDLSMTMQRARMVSSLASSIRKETNIPVRQPLQELAVDAKTFELINKSDFSEIKAILQDEVNVKEILNIEAAPKDWPIKTLDDYFASLNVLISDDLKIEGDMRELIREVQKLRKDSGVLLNEKLKIQYKNEERFIMAVEKFGEQIKEKTSALELIAGSNFEIKSTD
jgi:isoleucyl-tRNA synthetase